VKPGQTAEFDVKHDKAQYAWGVTRANGTWADQQRFELKADAVEHKDWHARQARTPR